MSDGCDLDIVSNSSSSGCVSLGAGASGDPSCSYGRTSKSATPGVGGGRSVRSGISTGSSSPLRGVDGRRR